MKKIQSFLSKAKSKLTALVFSATMAVNGACATVLAVNNGDGGATNKAKAIANVLVKIFPLMGGFFVLSGVIKWVMAFRSEQPEQQASAVKEIIIGVVCIVFGTFLWTPISTIVFG